MYYCNKFNREEKQKFSTTTYSNKVSKVSTNECDINGQPEIATWLPKPEIVVSLELQLIASKFQRQVG